MKNEIQDPSVKEINIGHDDFAIERNKTILTLLSNDMRPKEIADCLSISTYNVRNYIKKMMAQNGYHSISALVAAALRQQLIY